MCIEKFQNDRLCIFTVFFNLGRLFFYILLLNISRNNLISEQLVGTIGSVQMGIPIETNFNSSHSNDILLIAIT